jgi:hypothetical protein
MVGLNILFAVVVAVASFATADASGASYLPDDNGNPYIDSHELVVEAHFDCIWKWCLPAFPVPKLVKSIKLSMRPPTSIHIWNNRIQLPSMALFNYKNRMAIDSKSCRDIVTNSFFEYHPITHHTDTSTKSSTLLALTMPHTKVSTEAPTKAHTKSPTQAPTVFPIDSPDKLDANATHLLGMSDTVGNDVGAEVSTLSNIMGEVWVHAQAIVDAKASMTEVSTLIQWNRPSIGDPADTCTYPSPMLAPTVLLTNSKTKASTKASTKAPTVQPTKAPTVSLPDSQTTTKPMLYSMAVSTYRHASDWINIVYSSTRDFPPTSHSPSYKQINGPHYNPWASYTTKPATKPPTKPSTKPSPEPSTKPIAVSPTDALAKIPTTKPKLPSVELSFELVGAYVEFVRASVELTGSIFELIGRLVSVVKNSVELFGALFGLLGTLVRVLEALDMLFEESVGWAKALVKLVMVLVWVAKYLFSAVGPLGVASCIACAIMLFGLRKYYSQWATKRGSKQQNTEQQQQQQQQQQQPQLPGSQFITIKQWVITAVVVKRYLRGHRPLVKSDIPEWKSNELAGKMERMCRLRMNTSLHFSRDKFSLFGQNWMLPRSRTLL